MRLYATLVFAVTFSLAGCEDDRRRSYDDDDAGVGASTGTGSGASGSTGSTGGASESSGSGDPYAALCEQYATQFVACCPPDSTFCTPDKHQDLVDWCLLWRDACPEHFQCAVQSGPCTADACPTIGDGGCSGT